MLRIVIATGVASILVVLVLWLIPNDEIDPHDRQQVDHAARADALRPAAKSGDPKAQYALAQHYMEGRGVKESTVKAARWLKKAAGSGHILAQCELARLYDTGGKLKEDFCALPSGMNQWPGLLGILGRSLGMAISTTPEKSFLKITAQQLAGSGSRQIKDTPRRNI